MRRTRRITTGGLFRRTLAAPYPWTSSRRTGACVTKIALHACPLIIEASVAGDSLISPGNGTSAFEEVLQQLPSDARSQLAGALIEGKGVCSGSQPALAAARLSCKALRRVIDDGLHSLRLNVLPDTDQGPAPSLSGFPNVTSLTLSIDADWAEPTTDCSGSCRLLPNEQPAPNMDSRSQARAYPPSLLLGPLFGQPLVSLRRLRNLTLVGQLTCFKSFGKQLRAAFRACNESEASSSGGDSETLDDSDSSEEGASGSSAGAGCTANTAGSGEGGSGRAAGSCCLAHLDLGNVRFPLESAHPKIVARGHAALGPLGLQELTLGVELLPGVQAHQELRRLHLYVQQNDSEETVLEDKCLQRLPLRHVSILLGDLCDKFHIVPLLNALPDTVTSVCVAGPFHAALKLGQDGSGQATRELVLGDLDESTAPAAMGVLSAWPRGLPQAARLTLLEVGSISGMASEETDLLKLLARGERVQVRTVGGCCASLEELIPRLHTTPSEVLLEVPMESYPNSSITLRLAVGEGPSGGGGRGRGISTGEIIDSGEGRKGGAEAGDGPGQEEQEEARGGDMQLQLPTAEGLLARAMKMMEGRATRGDARQAQGSEGGREGSDPDLRNADEEEEEDEGKERGSFEHWWRYGRRAAHYGDGCRVLLLTGRGVSALLAHSTAEGGAALEGAFAELLRTCSEGSDRQWEYMVLPGDGCVLLYWDGGKAVEAVVRAVRGAAVAALGRELPEGDVRAVALPPCTLNSAWEGLSACARKVLQSKVRLSDDRAALVEQLQALEELWGDLQAAWDNPYSAARPVLCPAEEGEEEEGEEEEEDEAEEEQEAKRTACQPPQPRAPTTVMTRASRAAAAAAAAAAGAAAAPEAVAGASGGAGSQRRVGGGDGNGGKRRKEPEGAAGPGAEAETVSPRGRKRRRGTRPGAAVEGPAEKGAAAGPGAAAAGHEARDGGRGAGRGGGGGAQQPSGGGQEADGRQEDAATGAIVGQD